MMGFGRRVPADDSDPAPAYDAVGGTPSFRRVLVSVQDASQVQSAIELARRVAVPGLTEAHILHLSLREVIGGRRFALESQSETDYVTEAAVFELRMAGIGAFGQVRTALFDHAAQAIVAEAEAWGADLIVLGAPRRGEFATRLRGSVTLRVQQRAPCPVLVASTASLRRSHRAGQQRYAGQRSGHD
jgi:nucleotide-binding universal stress UspA family protein